MAKSRWESAWWHTLAWAIFGAGFVGAVAFVSMVIDAAPGNVLLVLAAGSRLSAYIGATVGEIGFLRGIWLDGSRRLAWLEDYAAALRRALRCVRAGKAREWNSHSTTSRSNIRAPSGGCSRTSAWSLQPGTVVAVVGENGAGKTTLVKLLVPDVPAHKRSHSGGRNRAIPHAAPRNGGRGLPVRFKISSDSSFGAAHGRQSAT